MKMSLSPRVLGVSIAVLACLWQVNHASAHGPCQCLDPRLVVAGGQVRITDENGRQAGGTGWPAYKVIFNPRPSDLGIAPSYLAGAYRADAVSRTVLSRSRTSPTRRGRFRVPADALSGLYMVLIFDGGEGGAHNTWDYLHVVPRRDSAPLAGVVTAQTTTSGTAKAGPVAAQRASNASGDNASQAWPLLVAALGLATGAAFVRSRRRRTGTISRLNP